MTTLKTIGESWDFAFYERQKKIVKMIEQYENARKAKYAQGAAIDDWEAK